MLGNAETCERGNLKTIIRILLKSASQINFAETTRAPMADFGYDDSQNWNWPGRSRVIRSIHSLVN